MNIEPASINQILDARDGHFVEIHADVGGVVTALKEIDPGFGVRFPLDAREPYWHVYHTSEDGRSTDLVVSVQAVQNKSGVWEGLDNRVVERIMQIGQESYDYAAELDAKNERAAKAKDEHARAKISENGEQLAHAFRKDLGYKGRAFIP